MAVLEFAFSDRFKRSRCIQFCTLHNPPKCKTDKISECTDQCAPITFPLRSSFFFPSFSPHLFFVIAGNDVFSCCGYC